MRYLLVLTAVLSLYQVVVADELKVHVRQASTVTTTKAVDSTQLVTEDGEDIGDAVLTDRDPVIAKGQPAVVFMVKTDPVIPAGKLTLKAVCTTATVKQASTFTFYVDKPGKHSVLFKGLSVATDPPFWEDTTVEVVVGPAPSPGPGPGPTPPPVPVDGLPIEGQGLRVVVVIESSEERLDVMRKQSNIVTSPELRSLLNSNCAIGPDGKTKEWRILDKDVQYTDSGNVWAKALKYPRQAVPWILISNGITGHSGPLPDTVEATIALVRQYLPNQSQKSSPSPYLGPTIEVHSPSVCAACQTWSQVVAPEFKDSAVIEFYSGSPVAIAGPVFVVRVGLISKTLYGYQTADSIRSTISSLGGVL